MNTHPVHALAPVFKWLDELIRDHGDQLYMALVYLSVPVIVWILCGGLRRKPSARQPHTSIIIIQAPERPPPPPPIIGQECDLPPDDDEDSFAA